MLDDAALEKSRKKVERVQNFQKSLVQLNEKEIRNNQLSRYAA